MPEVWVFPGGRVDATDRDHPVESALPSRVQRRLAARSDAPEALAIAALRETHEETGLVVGRLRQGVLEPALGKLDYVGRAITPAGNPIRYHARFFCVRWDDPHVALQGSGELEQLEWLPVEQALALPTIDVTDIMLKEAIERVRSREGARRPTLFVHYRGTTPIVRSER